MSQQGDEQQTERANIQLTPYMESLRPVDDAHVKKSNSFVLLASIPSDSPLPHARSLETAKLSQLQSQYEQGEMALRDLEPGIQAAEQDSFDLHAAIAPVNRIPAEIFGVIFTIHVWEHKESPWILTQVSRFWRASAFMTSSIWGRIILTPPGSTGCGKPPSRNLEGMEICFEQVQLARALKRAGAVPLDLKLTFTPMSRPDPIWTLIGSPNGDELLTLLDFIPKQQVNPRLCSLSLEIGRSLIFKPDQFEAFTFSNLTSLAFDGLCPQLMDKAVAECQQLRKLHVNVTNIRTLRVCTWWSELEELGISDFCPAEELTAVRSALSDAKALKSLKLEENVFAGFHIIPRGFEQLSMLSIQRLRLQYLDDFWPIDCPNLTHLRLYNPPGVAQLANGSIRLPHLVELKVVTSWFANIFHVFDVPSLQILDLQCTWGASASSHPLKADWPFMGRKDESAASNIEPYIWILRRIDIDQMQLARTLMKRTLLREFSTAEVEITSKFFNALFSTVHEERTSKKSQESLHGEYISSASCPNMKTLMFDLCHALKLEQERAELEKSANAWIKARCGMGVPLERVAIRYSREEGWRELVERVS